MRTPCAAALKREEEKALQVIRQAARNGETQGCRNIATAIVNSRKVSRRLQTVKFRLDSVEINLQQQRCMHCLHVIFCDERECDSVGCPQFTVKRAKYFTVSSLKDLFYHVNAHVIVDFIKDIGFYNYL